MREILFRGQTRRKGEKVKMDGTPVESNWVYGGVFRGDGDHSIIYSYDPVEKFPVYSDTIGQYTGLTDLAKKILFEHDVVTAKFKSNGARYNFKIVFKDGAFLFDNGSVSVGFDEIRSVRKIGNIHDNPELLEGGDGNA